MTIMDTRLAAEAAYWGWMEEWTETIPEIPLWVDMQRADYMPYPREYFPTMALSFDPLTYRWILGKIYGFLFSDLKRAGERVLEIGCGSGFLSLEMARMGKRVTAFDLSEKRIRLAKKYYHRIGEEEDIPGKIDYFVANADHVKLKRDHFDVVLFHGALHHLGDVRHILNIMFRLVRTKGLLMAFEHAELDPRIGSFFSRTDRLKAKLAGKKRLCHVLDILFKKEKKPVDHPIRPEGASPMEDISAVQIEETLDQSPFACVREILFSPFSFHFIERYVTVFDWRTGVKIPALFVLKAMDCLLEKAGFRGELIYWVGEKV